MTKDIEELTAIFREVSDGETVTEPQREGHSHAPIEGDDEMPDVTRDGLEDAVDDSFGRDAVE